MSMTLPYTFRQLLDSLPIAAYLLKPEDRRVVGANPMFCSLMGFTEQELMELDWPTILMPDYHATAEVVIRTKAMAESITEWHFQKKDGSPLKVYGKYRLTQVVDDHHKVHELYFTVLSPIEQVVSAKEFFGE
jgi:PAS domain S-box-containing protein